ncbi:MAG: tetratricopeptide repeat protein, partial [Thermoanaerobaculia bacterium]
MWERVPASSPKRIYAKLYRGLARRHLFRELTEEEVAEAEGDLVAFVEAVPDSDLGWASLAGARLAIGHQHDLDGETRRAREKLEEAQESIRRALEAVPDGPEVAMVVVDHLRRKRRNDEAAVSEAEMAAAVDHLVELVEADWSPILVSQTAQLLRSLPSLDGPARSAVMLQRYLDDHPDAHSHRLILARQHYLLSELDTAYETAAAIVGAELLPVSFLARHQLSLRTQAASLLVDIECRRWEQADVADKADRIEPIESAVKKLVSLVGDAKDHRAVIRAEGKLAVAKGDFETGAAKLERLVRSREADLEVYNYVALALHRLGQYGRALERVDAALAFHPGSAAMLPRKAQLQYKLGRFDEASLTVKAALALDPENVALQELASAIQVRNLGEGEATDPLARALADARAARSEGDLESARATLLAALEAAPNSVLILHQLIRIEKEVGLTEAARTHLKKGFELQPGNDIFRRLEADLDNDDPVLAQKQYAQTVHDEEGDQAVLLAINLATLATRLDAAVDAAADPEDADRLRGQAANAGQEAERYLALAKRLRPDDPRLLEHRFTKALFDKDWTAAEALVERARDLNSDQADGFLFEGRYHFMREHFRQAVRAFTEATDRKPYSSPAWRLLALAYERVGNFGEARDAYEQAYRCNPTDIMTLRRYIPALLRAQEKHRALQVVRTVRKLVPGDIQLRELWLGLEVDTGNLAVALQERGEIYRE